MAHARICPDIPGFVPSHDDLSHTRAARRNGHHRPALPSSARPAPRSDERVAHPSETARSRDDAQARARQAESPKSIGGWLRTSRPMATSQARIQPICARQGNRPGRARRQSLRRSRAISGRRMSATSDRLGRIDYGKMRAERGRGAQLPPVSPGQLGMTMEGPGQCLGTCWCPTTEPPASRRSPALLAVALGRRKRSCASWKAAWRRPPHAFDPRPQGPAQQDRKRPADRFFAATGFDARPHAAVAEGPSALARPAPCMGTASDPFQGSRPTKTMNMASSGGRERPVAGSRQGGATRRRSVARRWCGQLRGTDLQV